jgi:hypothetical protein
MDAAWLGHDIASEASSKVNDLLMLEPENIVTVVSNFDHGKEKGALRRMKVNLGGNR